MQLKVRPGTSHRPQSGATDGPRVVLLDADLGRRARLRDALGEAGIASAGESGAGIEGINLVRETEPDAVFVALSEQSPRALQTIESLTAHPASPPILAYSKSSDASAMRAAMGAGARDYVVVPASSGELDRSLQRVLAQEQRRRSTQTVAGAGGAPSTTAGQMITVFGAKGGVGKTTIACNLAVRLCSETGQSVALVDLDTRFGDAALALDVPVETSVADLARDVATVTREQVRTYLSEHASGVMLLPAPPNPVDWGDISVEDVERVLDLLTSTYDYVVVDTPGTFNDIVASAVERASSVLVVTSLDVVSVKDTWLALEMLESWGLPEERLKLVTNRNSPDSVVSELDVAAALGRGALARIPYDRAVSAASAVMQPVVLARPRSQFSVCVDQLARSLTGAEPARRRGLFGWFARSGNKEIGQ